MDNIDKYCDVVMKGGVTSGIVYPSAILELAKTYRFKSIGGTSAGAIAAAATAAAALGERRLKLGGNPPLPKKTGMKGLEAVAADLGKEDFIYGLFQPALGLRNAYRVLVKVAATSSKVRRFLWLLAGVVLIAPIEAIIIAAAFISFAYLSAGAAGVWAAAFPALLCAFLGAAIAAVLRVTSRARSNLLGLCSGMRPAYSLSPKKEALTEWLHRVLQELSGQPMGEPLTFKDLNEANRYEGEPEGGNAIDLTMITTSVSHREPRSLPFGEGRFYFVPDQFERLFPDEVVKWMQRRGNKVVVNGVNYWPLPEFKELPVLVAARMSLSFPFLVSAVPLYQEQPNADPRDLDHTDRVNKNVIESTESLTSSAREQPSAGIAEMRICWFSDGGISSNFPIHLFDGPLPRWPTFAINLVYPNAGASTRQGPAVVLPPPTSQTWPEIYESISRPTGISEMSMFGFGIVATMQNWRDTLQARAPGHRERIVQVALADQEGGLNLRMPGPTLKSIQAKGQQAGAAFQNFDFESHYWIRWRNLSSALDTYTRRVTFAATYRPKIQAFVDAYEQASQGVGPSPTFYPFVDKKAGDQAQILFEDLVSQGRKWTTNKISLSEGAPAPNPQLQIAPTF